MTLHRLRQRVGDHAFFRILRRWARSRAGDTVTTAQFIRLAERVCQATELNAYAFPCPDSHSALAMQQRALALFQASNDAHSRPLQRHPDPRSVGNSTPGQERARAY